MSRTSFEHEYFADQMGSNPGFRDRLLESAAVNTAQWSVDRLYHRPVAAVLRGLATPVHTAFARRGIHPQSLNLMVRAHGRLRVAGKGSFIRSVRSFTGLPERSPGDRNQPGVDHL